MQMAVDMRHVVPVRAKKQKRAWFTLRIMGKIIIADCLAVD